MIVRDIVKDGACVALALIFSARTLTGRDWTEATMSGDHSSAKDGYWGIGVGKYPYLGGSASADRNAIAKVPD